MILRIFTYALALTFTSVGSGGAQTSMDPLTLESRLTADERKLIQEALIWTGLYNRWIDGDFGPGTRDAIRRFQISLETDPTGYLTESDISLLIPNLDFAFNRYDWSFFYDRWSDVTIGLPLSIFDSREYFENGSGWTSNTASGIFYLYRFQNSYPRLIDQLYYEDLRSLQHIEVNFTRNMLYIVSGTRIDGWKIYARAEQRGSEVKGYVLSWRSDGWTPWESIAVAISNSFWPFERRPLTRPPYPTIDAIVARLTPNVASPPATAPSTPANPWSNHAGIMQPVGNGSGFFVSPDGHIITNYHVIAECKEVRLGDETLQIVSTNEYDDIAVLQLTEYSGDWATFRAGSTVSLGETVVAAGFPFTDLLNNDLNITPGIVSAIAGAGGDRRFVQVTAPIQPGNSGGPLLDATGNVIGVITSKLNWVTAASSSGSLPENINFAIRAPLVIAMLVAQGVEYQEESSGPERSVRDIAADALKHTVRIDCWR